VVLDIGQLDPVRSEVDAHCNYALEPIDVSTMNDHVCGQRQSCTLDLLGSPKLLRVSGSACNSVGKRFLIRLKAQLHAFEPEGSKVSGTPLA
jgi:hypothetical protein